MRSLRGVDIKERLLGVSSMRSVLQRAQQALHGPENDQLQEQWAEVSGALCKCLKDNNFRVCLGALECFVLLLDLVGDAFRPKIGGLLPTLTETLGDGKADVRAAGIAVAMAVLSIAPPDRVFDKLKGAFTHKNPKLRDSVLRLLARYVAERGALPTPCSYPSPSTRGPRCPKFDR